MTHAEDVNQEQNSNSEQTLDEVKVKASVK